jgi:arachidonate 15-lipoxygenase
LFPKPVLPDEYKNGADLGFLAVAGPYACFVEKAPEGGYHWDFRKLDRYEHHQGLRSLGVRVMFRVDEPLRRLQASQIECELGICKPGEANWDLATKMALCAATTYVSLVRHFNWVHLAAGGPLAIATRNSFPKNHPVKRLLWPHIYGTQYSNELVTKGQMVEGGDFETIFSFTQPGMCKLFEESYKEYDITTLDPVLDAERRGIKDAGFETPALTNRQAHFDLMHAHALEYLRLYYSSDQQLNGDPSFQSWVDELQRMIPGGIQKLLGSPTTIERAARLIAAFIYLATVEHEILGTGVWNYQMWTHIEPVRIYKNGAREPVDVYQRLVNANFNLNVSRAPLMQDFSGLAIDAQGAAAFRRFLAELGALQSRLEQEPFAHWKIYPRILEANINA